MRAIFRKAASERKRLTVGAGVVAALAISLTSLVFSMTGLVSARTSGGYRTASAEAGIATAGPGAGAGSSAARPSSTPSARSTARPASTSILIEAEPKSKGKSKSKSKGKGKSNSKSEGAGVDGHRISTKPYADGLLLLGTNKKFPTSAIPTVNDSNAVGGKTLTYLTPSCPPTTVDLGTWCLESSVYPVPNEDQGKNNYFWASQACTAAGGWLPSAAQLIGAATRVSLESTIHDSHATALIDEEPDNGLKDAREMTSTLVTTAAGSSAAGSEGVSEGTTGNPEIGEPNPTPEPAVPEPETLQYVTVYSNGTKGGFAGSEWVGQAENFRCAYNPTPGAGQEEEE